MDDRGLAADGTVAREGALDRVPAAFTPVVDAARARIAAAFSGGRLHSAYLYGSVPRGSAIPGVSDLDMLIALRDEPADADLATAKAIGAELDRGFPQIQGAGILVDGTRALLSERERYDDGFFVACLCTPLLGEDLARYLPRYRPTGRIARDTNGDLAAVLMRWSARAAESTTADARLALSRTVARRIVRTGFTLIMPAWGGWTSDLYRSAALFGHYYPERSRQMRIAAATARTPTSDPEVIGMLIDDLGPWLAAEHTAVHGAKKPHR
ncbi:nucleotidyltransferase domain-containing protein [Streptomonospora salina]|uniref:Putative nucleotidyltransferase n=1 Tax=Streptomonospora salina TaxID=104205 RepID=A0A841E450_9ACTN|nr:nucleotidyltransferase domain-containing protein [Streptomonospora salina]MBB5998627.1 putative nucleotidyltransferase [Streptomonospora salina]